MAYLEPVTDQWLIETRRQIHAWPEPGWAEFVSAARVIEHLEKENLKVLCGREVINEKFIRINYYNAYPFIFKFNTILINIINFLNYITRI